MEAAVWLGVYPDGALRVGVNQRDSSGDHRHRCRLEPAGFLRSRLVGLGGEGHDAALLAGLGGGLSHKQRGHHTDHIPIIALLRISSRHGQHAREILSDWGAEAELLWNYLRDPKDAYTVKIAGVKSCAHDEFISYRHARLNHHRDAGGSAKISLQHPLFHASMGVDASGVLLSDAGRAGGTVSARDVLEEWSVSTDADPNDIPFLLVPIPVGLLVQASRWHTLLLLTSWHSNLHVTDRSWARPEGPIPGFPPQGSASWTSAGAAAAAADTSDPKFTFDVANVDKIVAELKRWAPTILAAQEEGDRGGEKMMIEDSILKLQAWSSALSIATGEKRTSRATSRLKYDSCRMLECIRFSQFITSGPEKLLDMVRRSLQLALPPILGGAIDQVLGNSALRMMPSASVLRHTELAFEVALLLMQRERQPADHVVFMWADSSPISGYDWLWVQHHSVKKANLRRTCAAVWALSTAVASASKEIADHIGLGPRPRDRQPLEERLERTQLMRMLVDELISDRDWTGLLHTIRDSIDEHIHPPAALGAGHRGLLDKVKAATFAWNLQVRDRQALDSFADSVMSFTSDMGHELSIPDCPVEDLAALLPAWCDRAPKEVDVDEPGTADIDATEAAAPPPPPRSDHCLQNAFTIPGLQHIVDNLSSDVHKEMPGWSRFYAICKQVEALLRPDEKRQRFVSRCVLNSEYADRADTLRRFSASLYEGRWKEVINFLSELKPLLFVLYACWDLRKWNSEAEDPLDQVDREQPQERARQQQDDRQGITRLDAAAITQAFQSSFFATYVHMALFIEEIPVRLARWGESCVCHGDLYQWLSPYYVAIVYKAHYGDAWETCPMAGKMSPELATGRLEEVAEQVWADSEDSVHRAPKYPRAAPLTESEKDEIIRAHWKAKSHVLALLQMKLGHWQKLPWILIGMAAVDEDKARESARRALRMFDIDPRQEAHHRITWKWLRPGCMLRLAVQDFAAGVRRECLPEDALSELSVFRFIPCVETTIEEKHSRVAKSRRRHFLSPVRISLSNRMPLFERLVARAQISMVKFLELFGHARHLRKVSVLLNIAEHAELSKRRISSSKRRKTLSGIIYQVDLQSLFRTARAAKQYEKKRKVSRTKAEAKLIADAMVRETLSFGLVKTYTMQQHFAQVCTSSSSVTYSVPRSDVVLHPLHSALSKPSSTPREALPTHEIDVDCDEDDDRTVFFQVVVANPAKKKLMHIAPGAGGKIRSGSVAVTCHKSGSLSNGGQYISMEPVAMPTSDAPDPVFLLQEFTTGKAASIERSLCASQHKGLMFALPDLPAFEADEESVSDVLALLTEAGARGDGGLNEVELPRALQPTLSVLCDKGFVDRRGCEGDVRLCLTDRGAGSMVSRQKLGEAVPIYRIRPNIPLGDKSEYELMSLLEENGWTWNAWIPPSKRRRSDAPLPLGYKLGAEKHWFSTMAPPRSYMACLLNAEELLLDDPSPDAMIPHGEQQGFYRKVLAGEKPSQGRATAITWDIDDEDPRLTRARPGDGKRKVAERKKNKNNKTTRLLSARPLSAAVLFEQWQMRQATTTSTMRSRIAAWRKHCLQRLRKMECLGQKRSCQKSQQAGRLLQPLQCHQAGRHLQLQDWARTRTWSPLCRRRCLRQVVLLLHRLLLRRRWFHWLRLDLCQQTLANLLKSCTPWEAFPAGHSGSPQRRKGSSANCK